MHSRVPDSLHLGNLSVPLLPGALPKLSLMFKCQPDLNTQLMHCPQTTMTPQNKAHGH